MGEGHQVPKANTQYMGHSHEELKNWTDAGQPADANGLADSWKDLGNGLSEAAENLMVAVFGSQAGWTGQAANAMRAQLQKVAEWSQKTGDSFKKASSAFDTQGESVGTAKNSMPDPVQYNPGQMIKEAAASGNVVNIAMLPYTMYKQREAQQEAHAQAAQIVAKRDAELAAAAASIPPFEPPPKMNENGGKEPGPGQPGMPGSSGPRPGMPGGGSRGGVGGGAGGGAGGGGGGGFGGGGGIPGFGGGGAGGGFGPNDPNNPNGNGDDNQQTPPSVGMPSLPVGSGTGTSGFSHTPTNFGGGPGGLPPGGIPGGAGPAGGGGGFGGAFGGGFGPGGAPRPGGGFGGMAPGGAAGAGAGSGAGAGPGAGGMAGGRGAGMAGGRGAGGMGAGGMGAGRGQGGEDDEHQRPSYLVEPDPDATFGTDQMTAPPVIGG